MNKIIKSIHREAAVLSLKARNAKRKPSTEYNESERVNNIDFLFLTSRRNGGNRRVTERSDLRSLGGSVRM